jgi:hypothetical protein
VGCRKRRAATSVFVAHHNGASALNLPRCTTAPQNVATASNLESDIGTGRVVSPAKLLRLIDFLVEPHQCGFAFHQEDRSRASTDSSTSVPRTDWRQFCKAVIAVVPGI